MLFRSYSLVTTVLMGALLCYRSVQMEKRRREMAHALSSARELSGLQQARVAEQSELITMLTHELKTPLSVLSMMLTGSFDQIRQRDRALRAIENMRGIIDRCAHIAYLEDKIAGKAAALSVEAVDMARAIGESIASQKESGCIAAVVAAELPVCRTDRKLLQVIIGNLLDNAVKYRPPDSQVRLTAERGSRDGRQGVSVSVFNAVGQIGRAHV